jgi:Tol biopolymer transport system component
MRLMQMHRTRLALALAAAVFIGIAVFVSVGGSDDSKAPAPEQPPASPTAVAPSKYSNIYAVDVKTRTVRELTRNRDEEIASQPSWSRKGRIAFGQAPEDEAFARLIIMRPDGKGKREVPTRITHLFQPSWSPDGRRVVLSKLGSGIYLVDPRNGASRRLTRGEADEGPAWSPKGDMIVFQRQVSPTNWDLYSVSPAGGRPRPLTRDPLQQINATWSPDGRRLVFAEQERNGNWVVVSMKTDGADRRKLTSERKSSQEPSWSPDGRKIAFVIQEGVYSTIGVMSASGGRVTRVTNRSLVASAPSWSPDSKKITFDGQVLSAGAHGH